MRLVGFALLSLVLGACVESGQILGLAPDESPGASGGAPGSGGTMLASGGTPQGMGGMPDVEPGPVGSVVTVDGGDLHTCGIVDGALYCWGDNATGALGLGDFESRVVATRIGSDSGWTQVGAGDGFSCGILAGDVFCWGSGSSGQLGNGQFSSAPTPQAVPLPSGAVELSVGHSHACVILDDRSLHCWGQNTEGQLAQEDPWAAPGVDSPDPVPVASGTTWDQISCGQGHTCGIQMDGTLWCWGRNARGEHGQGVDQADQTRTPFQTGTDSDWVDIAAGQNHTCGVRGTELYCWGDNSHRQLGGAIGEFVEVPSLMPVPNAVQTTVDTFHSCAIDDGGQLFCWGRNIEGELGDGTIEARGTPSLAVPSGPWEKVSAGRFHTCGVRDGAILCTGDNAPGRLGVGDDERRREYTPTVYAP